jgi:hypothetical protein
MFTQQWIGVPVALMVSIAAVAQTSAARQTLTADARVAVVTRIVEVLERQYVFPEIAARMADAVRAHVQAGRYDRLDDPTVFAQTLTDDLRAVSKDKHLGIVHRSAQAAQPNAPSGGPTIAGERLEGNIGYLRLDGFPAPERLGPAIDPLMKTLAGTDALLIDLRQNRGGAANGAMYVAGYFFPKTQLVARIYSRPNNQTTEMWTEEVAGPRYLNKPVYILTSTTTFSAAEALAYHLTHLGRARTVGETTGGGAHRVQAADLGHEFRMMVPFTRPINVVTNGDWEGTGVPPAMASPAADALRAAHMEALRTLPPTPERTAVLEKLKQGRR